MGPFRAMDRAERFLINPAPPRQPVSPSTYMLLVSGGKLISSSLICILADEVGQALGFTLGRLRAMSQCSHLVRHDRETHIHRFNKPSNSRN